MSTRHVDICEMGKNAMNNTGNKLSRVNKRPSVKMSGSTVLSANTKAMIMYIIKICVYKHTIQ